MKKTFLIMLLLTFTAAMPFTANANPAYYTFTYDAAGNCITKVKIEVGFRKGDEESKTLDLQGKYTVNIYPNPAKQDLNLNITGMQKGLPASFLMYDLHGTLVLSNDNLKDKNVIDMSPFGSGTYILNLKVGDYQAEIKIVKDM